MSFGQVIYELFFVLKTVAAADAQLNMQVPSTANALAFMLDIIEDPEAVK